MRVLTTPSFWGFQLALPDPVSGHPKLAVFAKRTYLVDRSQRLGLAAEQMPLFAGIVPYEDNPALIALHPETLAFKPFSDLIVKGHAYAAEGERQFIASVQLSNILKRVLVIGDRQLTMSEHGSLGFSDPEPIREPIPLRYDRAYGGTDAFAGEVEGEPMAELESFFGPDSPVRGAKLFAYPRNPEGRGFLMYPSPESVAATQLPNLEDPDDVLTPARIAVGKLENWPSMPLPCCTDVTSPMWFPRAAYLGEVPPYDAALLPFEEERRGLSFGKPIVSKNEEEVDYVRASQVASTGLSFAMRGDERVTLTRMHRRHEQWSFKLPGEAPKMWIDGRKGKLIEVQARVSNVAIEPDDNRVTITWCGVGNALRHYAPDETPKMPFRIEWPS